MMSSIREDQVEVSYVQAVRNASALLNLARSRTVSTTRSFDNEVIERAEEVFQSMVLEFGPAVAPSMFRIYVQDYYADTLVDGWELDDADRRLLSLLAIPVERVNELADRRSLVA